MRTSLESAPSNYVREYSEDARRRAMGTGAATGDPPVRRTQPPGRGEARPHEDEMLTRGPPRPGITVISPASIVHRKRAPHPDTSRTHDGSGCP